MRNSIPRVGVVLILVLIALVCMWGSAGFADESQFDAGMVVNQETIDDLWKLRPHIQPELASYVVLDRTVRLEPELAEVLSNWVAGGHGLIMNFQTAASFFGQSVVTGNQITASDSYTLYKVPGTTHPLTYLIDAVKVSRRYYYSSSTYTWNYALDFSSLENVDATYLFQTAADQKLVAAINHGLGRIIVVGVGNFGSSDPLLASFPNGIDSERFREAMRTWLSGGVTTAEPIPSSSGGQEQALDSIHLKNGDRLYGLILDSELHLDASYASFSLSVGDIYRVTFEGAGVNLDLVELRAGDRISGVIQDTVVTIGLPSGATLEIDVDEIDQILLAARQ